jgi:cytochrome c-type biogenesis protein CcmE
MVKGNVVTGVIAVGAVIAVMVAFLNNGSPYMTMSQAVKSHDEHIHLAGDLVKDSLHNDLTKRTLEFKLKDSEGTIVQVVYKGEVPANMSEATKVVAIGHVVGGDFSSDKLLVKCPSKYEEQPAQGSSSKQI